MTTLREAGNALFPLSRYSLHPEYGARASEAARVLAEIVKSKKFRRASTLARASGTSEATVEMVLDTLPRLGVIQPRFDEEGRISGATKISHRRHGVWIEANRWISHGIVMSQISSNWPDRSKAETEAKWEAARKGSAIFDTAGLPFYVQVGMLVLRLNNAVPVEAVAHLPPPLPTLGHDPLRFLEAAHLIDQIATLRAELADLEAKDNEALIHHELETRKAHAGLRTRVVYDSVQTGYETVKRTRDTSGYSTGYWGDDTGVYHSSFEEYHEEVPTFKTVETNVPDFPAYPNLSTERRIKATNELKKFTDDLDKFASGVGLVAAAKGNF